METLKSVTSLSPSHVSLYGLILEEGTPLYDRRESLTLPSEDEECDMYFAACDYMKEAGYDHYEVSNYAIEGRACRHNLKYWRGEEYIGLGLSAYSYYEGKRFGKGRDMSEYLLDPTRASESEVIDLDGRKYEYVMLRTRLIEGFSLSEYERLFGEDFVQPRSERIESFIKSGYVMIKDGRFSFTEKGLYVGNSLLTELI